MLRTESERSRPFFAQPSPSWAFLLPKYKGRVINGKLKGRRIRLSEVKCKDHLYHMPRSPQDDYAENLKNNDFGLPIYHPIPCLENSGRVGDVGFFQRDGVYCCLANAFDAQVLRISSIMLIYSIFRTKPGRHSQLLNKMQWMRSFSVPFKLRLEDTSKRKNGKRSRTLNSMLWDIICLYFLELRF